MAFSVGTAASGFGRVPRLIVFSGLPGAGKSTLARELARRTGAEWLRVDTIEAALVKAGLVRSFETGLAAYLVARDLAEDRLRVGGDVIVDAVNGVEPARAMWRELAATCRARRYVVEVSCTDALEHRRRVVSRAAPTPPLPEPTWEEVVAREYHPWTEPVLRVDGTEPTGRSVPEVLRYCGFRRGGPPARANAQPASRPRGA